MNHFTTSLAVFAITLSHLVAATPTPQSPSTNKVTYPDYVHPSNGICEDYTIQKTVTYEELKWNLPSFKDNFDVVGLLAKVGSSPKIPFSPFSGSQNMTKSFSISATFCKPKTRNDSKQNIVLVATHGAGFDRRYWASSFEPDNYNFAQYALNAGYSIFYYDRLGLGQSSHVPANEAQGGVQTELLASLLKSLRASQYTLDVKPNKLVLVGHSYGSALTSSVLKTYPELADAAVLTGFAFPKVPDPAVISAAWVPSVFAVRLLSTLPPVSKPQFSDKFEKNWVSFVDIFSYVQAFLGDRDYTSPAAEYSFRIAQPISAAEFLYRFKKSSGAKPFKGRILLAAGGADILFCDGDCQNTIDIGSQQEEFPDAKFDYFVQKGAGHGQNFAENAKDMFGAVIKFVSSL